MSIRLCFLGHSCFRVESGEFSVVLDPYAPGSVPGLGELHETADLVLCSHDHHDHNCREAVMVSDDGRKNNPFRITAVASFHDDQNGALRGKNTITVLEAEGKKIVHFGDVGCMPGPLALEKLKDADVILLPVGGHYTVGPEEAKEIADAVNAKTIVPMHYRSDSFGFDVIGRVEDFLSLYDSCTYLHTDILTVDDTTPAGVAVLDCKMAKA